MQDILRFLKFCFFLVNNYCYECCASKANSLTLGVLRSDHNLSVWILYHIQFYH